MPLPARGRPPRPRPETPPRAAAAHGGPPIAASHRSRPSAPSPVPPAQLSPPDVARPPLQQPVARRRDRAADRRIDMPRREDARDGSSPAARPTPASPRAVELGRVAEQPAHDRDQRRTRISARQGTRADRSRPPPASRAAGRAARRAHPRPHRGRCSSAASPRRDRRPAPARRGRATPISTHIIAPTAPRDARGIGEQIRQRLVAPARASQASPRAAPRARRAAALSSASTAAKARSAGALRGRPRVDAVEPVAQRQNRARPPWWLSTASSASRQKA